MQLGSCCIGPPALQPDRYDKYRFAASGAARVGMGRAIAVQESRSVAEHDAARTRSASMKDRKTDYGTVILHWLFAAGLGVAFVTGLRIATEAPDRQWLNFVDAILPREDVWVPHMQAALLLVALALAYAVYLFRSGLTTRVRLDQIRLRGLFGKGQVRLRALNAVLTWALFSTIAALLVSGGLLYFGLFAGHDVAMVHWYATWAIPALVSLHVLVHARLGGVSQLLRILRP